MDILPLRCCELSNPLGEMVLGVVLESQSQIAPAVVSTGGDGALFSRSEKHSAASAACSAEFT